MFRKLYQWTIQLAKHKMAIYWLGFVGFIESIFFPIPADIMLVPMCLAKPNSAYKYVVVISVTSIIGGIIGYFIGYLFSDYALSIINNLGKAESFNQFQSFFQKWGIPFIFIASVTPIPYKIAAIGSGLIPINFFVFLIGSILFRPIRFFIEAWAIKKGGAKLEKKLSQYIEVIGWGVLAIFVLLLTYYFFK